MRIVCISDTHALHKSAFGLDKPIRLPLGDVLVCAGDITDVGDIWDIHNFAEYFKDIEFKAKITIAGNHDFCFERQRLLAKENLEKSGWIYLQDEEVVIDGVKFYGSPWQPEFCDWAFNLPRGEKLARVWDNIPLDTDVLITHGPPWGILDWVLPNREQVGCEELLKAVYKVKPMLHVFGHIHEARGLEEHDGITFCNASICTVDYKPSNKPFVFDFDPITGNLSRAHDWTY